MSGPAWTIEGAQLVADYVTRRTGLVFAPYRRPEFERALRSLCARGTAAEPRRLLERLQSDAETWESLIEQVTIGETYFFREPGHFEFVRREVLPQLISLRGPLHGFRVWSAGCATGEEAYSLAIVLREHGLLRGASVLGTDLSPVALERARAATYRAWSLRNVEPRVLAPYFEACAGAYRIREELRESVEFKPLNLAEASYPSPFDGTSRVDLIFCRNVFIYLGAETIRGVAQRFFDSLAPGGFLVMGPSDPMLLDERFEVLTTAAGIVYRRPVRAAAARSSPQLEVERSLSPPRPLLRAPRPRRRTPADSADARPSDTARALVEIRSLAGRNGAASAEHACREALEAAPLSVELHYLMGLLLLELDDVDGAVAALRRVLYLDGSLAIAHYTLGQLLSRSGDRQGAERSYRNAEHFAAESGDDEALPLSDGLTAHGLARAARHELASSKGTTR